MAVLTLRSAKGLPLTHNEVDANFTSLNTDKIEVDDLSVTTNAAGSASLSYSSGVFTYTPPDLSSYLTSYTETDTLDSVTGRGATTTNGLTVGSLVINGEVEEQQYSLTGTDIDPSNGTIQYKTLSADTTFTESLSDGEYVILMINDGTGYTITWPTITWVGGSAPTLETTGYNVINIWQVNGTVYGVFVGAA